MSADIDIDFADRETALRLIQSSHLLGDHQ